MLDEAGNLIVTSYVDSGGAQNGAERGSIDLGRLRVFNKPPYLHTPGPIQTTMSLRLLPRTKDGSRICQHYPVKPRMLARIGDRRGFWAINVGTIPSVICIRFANT